MSGMFGAPGPLGNPLAGEPKKQPATAREIGDQLESPGTIKTRTNAVYAPRTVGLAAGNTCLEAQGPIAKQTSRRLLPKAHSIESQITAGTRLATTAQIEEQLLVPGAV